MKKSIFFLLLAFQLNTYSQVQLGQSSSEALSLLSYLMNDRPNWEMEKIYDQGNLQEVIIYQYDQIFNDLLIKLDATQRFVMQDDKYVLNILQFPSLTLDELKNKFDNHYENSRIEDYYFEDGFKFQRTLATIDGHASVLYQLTVIDDLPKTVMQQVTERQEQLKSASSSGAVTEYINSFQKHLMNNFKICEETKIIKVKIKQFEPDSEYDHLTYSHQTVFCDNEKEITLDYLIEQGVDGFYYFNFSNISFNEVVQMVMDAYGHSFDLSNMQLQKIEGEDPRSYDTMVQELNNGNRVIEVRSFYDGNPGGDYIRIEQYSDDRIQVHISYNGLM